MLERKVSTAFSHLGAGRLLGDTQETDYGVSMIVILQGLSLTPCSTA